MLDLLKIRLKNSFTTVPSSQDWFWIFVLLLVFALVVISFGFQSKFLQLEIPNLPVKAKLQIILVALFFPAVVEEAFFRVLLLPHTSEQISVIKQCCFAIASLILFIVYHPLNAYLFVHNARQTFNSFAFLISATILGIVCTIAYLISVSIYPSIMIHWIVVIFWLLVFGGHQKLERENNLV